MDKLLPEPDEYPRLKRRLQHCGNEFSLFFVKVNIPTFRSQISTRLISESTRPVVSIDMNQHQSSLNTESIDAIISRQLVAAPEDAIIFLFNLDQLLSVYAKQQHHPLLQQINWRRSGFARLNRPLVIWLPGYALDELAQFAPDFYDWYSAVYELNPTDQQVIFNNFINIDSQHIISSKNSSKKEKNRWLHTLLELLEESPHKNTQRTILLDKIGELYFSTSDYDLALMHLEKSLIIKNNIGDDIGTGTTLHNISQIFSIRGDHETALKYLKKSLSIRKKINDTLGEGRTLNSISEIFITNGNYEKAFKYSKESLDILRKLGDKSGESSALNSIAHIFIELGNHNSALPYLKKSLAITQEIGDNSGEAAVLNNISQVFMASDENETSLKYLEKSLAIQKNIGDKLGEGTTLNNISQVFTSQGDYNKALQYLKKSMIIQEETEDAEGGCSTLFNMGYVYMKNGNNKKSLETLTTAYKIATKINSDKSLKYLEKIAPEIGLSDGLDGWKKLAEEQSD